MTTTQGDAKYVMEVSLRKKVIDGLLWSAARTWGAKLLSFALFVVMSRLLSPQEFGVFASAVAVLAFIQLFVDQGLADSIVQRREITNAQLNAVFALNLGASMLVVAALWFSAPLIALRVNAEELTSVLRVASISVPLSALGLVQVAMNRRNFHFRLLAVRTMLATLVSGVVAIALAVHGLGTLALVAQFVLQAGIGTLMLWLHPQWTPSLTFDVAGLRQMMNYGFQRLGTNLLHYGNTKYVELYIAATLGAPVLGIYLVGVRVYEALLQMMSGAVLDVAHSGFSRLAKEPERLQAAYLGALKVSSATAVPLFVVVGLLAVPIIETCFGAKWLSSAPVMEMMALLGAVQVLQFYNGTVYNALGKPSIGLVFNLCKLVLTFSALWLVRGRPLNEVVAAYVGVQFAVAVPSFVLMRRFASIRLSRICAVVWPFLLSCGLAAGAVLMAMPNPAFVKQPPWLQVIAGSMVGLIVYAICVALFARRDFLGAWSLLMRRVNGGQHVLPPSQ